MKIAFLSSMGSDASWGGSEELWFRTARLALDRDHEVAVVVYRRPEIPSRIRELQERGALLLRPTRLDRWPRPRTLRWRLHWQLERLRVWDALASWGPEVVCVSHGTTLEMVPHWTFTQFVSRYAGPYVVIAQHSFEDLPVTSEGDRRTAATYLERARRVAFVAERNLRATERHLAAGVPNARVVRNPVNLADLRPVPYPRSDVIRMATVARLESHIKGQDVLFEALGGERWRWRDWRLRLYGAGGDRPYLERLARHYGIDGKVEFGGYVADVRSIWAENQLLVMPSRSEGTPLALVEAMICGRPAVATDVGGNIEWVDEPATGFIADAASARSLGSALERAWEVRDHWEAMGRRAHQAAAARMDPHPDETVLSMLVEAGEAALPYAYSAAPAY